jgi:hypothetical protein
MTTTGSKSSGGYAKTWNLCSPNSRRQPGASFEVLQVKEKFGGLRIHVTYANDAIPQCIEGAKEESFHICEVCGQSGTLREGQWIKTLCDDHAGARGAREIGW